MRMKAAAGTDIASGVGPEASRHHVAGKLAQLISEITNRPRETISNSCTIDELGMESVAFVELHVAIEDTYSIQVDPIRILELNNFGSIIDYILALIIEEAQM